MFRRTFLLAGASIFATPVLALPAAEEATLYKEPACGCCGGYAQYLRRHGIPVKVTETEDFAKIGRAAGVPEELEGCHVTMLGGYAISGHVPIEAVNQLLKARPPISGITLKGMPSGSPGMPGKKEGPWTVYAFSPDASAPQVFAEF